VDIAAATVLDLHDKSGFFHVVHPRPVMWDTVISLAAAEMNVPTIPYKDWMKKLESGEDGKGNDAVKLLDFFRMQQHGTL
jgi:hypothetical protein